MRLPLIRSPPSAITQFTTPPVEIEHSELVRCAIILGGKCLTWSSANVQLGVAVYVYVSAIGMAWNDATTKVPDFNSPKSLDLNRLARSADLLHRYLIVLGGNGPTRCDGNEPGAASTTSSELSGYPSFSSAKHSKFYQFLFAVHAQILRTDGTYTLSYHLAYYVASMENLVELDDIE